MLCGRAGVGIRVTQHCVYASARRSDHYVSPHSNRHARALVPIHAQEARARRVAEAGTMPMRAWCMHREEERDSQRETRMLHRVCAYTLPHYHGLLRRRKQPVLDLALSHQHLPPAAELNLPLVPLEQRSQPEAIIVQGKVHGGDGRRAEMPGKYSKPWSTEKEAANQLSYPFL